MTNLDVADTCVDLGFCEHNSRKAWVQQLQFLRGAVLLCKQDEKWGKLGANPEARLKADIKHSIFYTYLAMAQKVFRLDPDIEAGDFPPETDFTKIPELGISKLIVQGLQLHAKQLQAHSEELLSKLSECTYDRHCTNEKSWKHGLAPDAPLADLTKAAAVRLDFDVSPLDGLLVQLGEARFWRSSDRGL